MATSTDLRAAIEEVQLSLPEAGSFDIESFDERRSLEKLGERLGALPWWVISTVIHSVIFLLVTLLGVAMPRIAGEEEVRIRSSVVPPRKVEYHPQRPRSLWSRLPEVESEEEVTKPIVPHEPPDDALRFQTDNNMKGEDSRGQEQAISDMPLGSCGTVASIGVGPGGMAGCFGYRTGGGRMKAVGRFGGSKATESAVEAALRWLKRHQEPEGHWLAGKWDGKRDRRSSLAMTGLATLAFLGAGYTHKVRSPYRDTVRRAVRWLVSQQHENGGLLGKDGLRYTHWDGYCHSMASMALVEAYGMSNDPALKGPAQKTVDYSVKIHQKPYSGWRYKPGQEGDISHTGWFIMQLKSARVAGLAVDGAGFHGGMNFVTKLLGAKTGRSVYCLSQVSSANYAGGLGGQTAARRTAISMVCRLFMGVPRDDELMRKSSKWVLAAKPDWTKPDFYGLYYGTLAMFQTGGGGWKEWNEPMKRMLVDNQRGGGPLDGSADDVDGSWDADKGCWECGRVFSTALGALSLEVYYRYLPMYSK